MGKLENEDREEENEYAERSENEESDSEKVNDRIDDG